MSPHLTQSRTACLVSHIPRLGLMGASSTRQNILLLLAALESGLKAKDRTPVVVSRQPRRFLRGRAEQLAVGYGQALLPVG